MNEDWRKIKYRAEEDGRIGKMYCKCGEWFLTDDETTVGEIYDWGLIHRTRKAGHGFMSGEEWRKKFFKKNGDWKGGKR